MSLGAELAPKEVSTYSRVLQIAKYGKALQEIRDLIAARTDQEAVRVSLIASLLIFCFENLQGEPESAVRHIKSALNFM